MDKLEKKIRPRTPLQDVLEDVVARQDFLDEIEDTLVAIDEKAEQVRGRIEKLRLQVMKWRARSEKGSDHIEKAIAAHRINELQSMIGRLHEKIQEFDKAEDELDEMMQKTEREMDEANASIHKKLH